MFCEVVTISDQLTRPSTAVQFLHDQDLVMRFFNSPTVPQRQSHHVLTSLPDAYNYKVREAALVSFLTQSCRDVHSVL